jgi:hypothetical protein
MTTELVRAEPVAANLADMVRYADHLADANLLPAQYRQKPANVLYAMEYGRTLGITPIAAITGIHVIEGKPSASAALISGLVRQAGHKLRVTGNGLSATAQIVRADDPDFTYEVTWELRQNANGNPNAQDANLLNKDVWKKYPAAMLKARAISQVARDACEEVLFGLHYTPEELNARVDADGLPLDAEVQQLHRVQPAGADQWTTPAPQPQAVKPPEQQTADDAATFTNPDKIRELYRKAKDAALLTATVQTTSGAMELGAYLVARGQELAEPKAEKRQAADQSAGDDGVVDAEIVPSAEEQGQAAEAELRRFAEQVGLPGIDADFEAAKGLPLTEATADQIRGFLNELRGTAA